MGGKEVFLGCHAFFDITGIRQERQHGADYYDEEYEIPNNDDANNVIHQNILDFYRSLPSLHQVCLDINVTAQSIHECIADTSNSNDGSGTAAPTNIVADHDGMTPLHILAMNPYSDSGSIIAAACFHSDHVMANSTMPTCAVFIKDRRGKTPLDCLVECKEKVDCHTLLMTALCMHALKTRETGNNKHHP